MKKEFSCGAVLYREENGERKYLLLDYRTHWDFSKGKKEKGESEEDTVKRELEEETGIKDIKFKGYKKKINWFYTRKRETISKTAIYYLVHTKEKKVELSEEHVGYKWCTIKEVRALIRFKNTKDILEGAEKYLKKEA